MSENDQPLERRRVAGVDEVPSGRVKTITAGTHAMALTNVDEQFTAMDNRCPHQSGPLGERSIEIADDRQSGFRCPWYG